MSDSGSPDKGASPPKVGSYQLVRSLGTGGMSSVFHAVHVETGHDVAVKILPRSLAKNPVLLQRFFREAKSAEALEHPNIAAIFDRGFDLGRHYLVLEYVEGGDLHDRVRALGPFAPEMAVQIIREVAEGLRFAAGRGVIHRDIKPANLLRRTDGRVKIIDLGLALQVESEDERVTRDGTTVGTVDYMSPEQARDSRATSERSDIYSLGCTFYFLLTGSAPYPGGDIADKLGRHCLAPVPDVRERRPETSGPLADLVRRMMAKRPDDRFASYDALIEALDRLPEASGGLTTPQRLDALVADDDAEDDDSEPLLLVEATPVLRDTQTPPVLPSESSSPELLLVELGEPDPPPARISLARSAPRAGGSAAPAPTPEIDSAPTSPIDGRRGTEELPLSSWVAAGAILGLAIALIGFGVVRFLTPSSSSDDASPVTEERAEFLAEPDRPPRSRTEPPRIDPKPEPKPEPGPQSSLAWIEPVDPAPKIIPEPSYPAGLEDAAVPAWAKTPMTVPPGTHASVRRIPASDDPSDVDRVRAAIDRADHPAVIELADNGPFFEEDIKISGGPRTIRARPGFRPILKLDRNSGLTVRDRPGQIALEESDLTLEGIDLVVDLSDLPATKTTLFLLRGGDLTLRRCSVTILNRARRPFTLVRVEDGPGQGRVPEGTRVRVEETLIRGQATGLFDLASPTDLLLLRSCLLDLADTVITIRPTTGRGDRRVSIVRSLVAARGSFLELPGGRPTPWTIKLLGTTLTKAVGVDPNPLIRVGSDPSGGLTTHLGWEGHDVAYLGWPAWAATDGKSGPIVSGLNGARVLWRGTDPESRESKRGWPASVFGPEVVIDDLAGFAEDRPSIGSRVSSPSPSLLEETVGTVPRALPPEPVGRPERPGRPLARPEVIGDRGATSQNLRFSSSAPNDLDRPDSRDATDDSGALRFDLADPAYRGDLGIFLARTVLPGSGPVRIRVVGSGVWTMTPVRLPDGASVAIESRAGGGMTPSWGAVPGSSRRSLIELSNGDLSLSGISLTGSSLERVRHLIRVEDGHLAISRCSLTMNGGANPDSLIEFRATNTKPLTGHHSPFRSPIDRPGCLISDSVLWAKEGDTIRAEMGRGVVRLINTVVINEGEGGAIRLQPLRETARGRFEADLILDECTIAAAGSLVVTGDWPGTAPGPDRPWLVSSARTAFLAIANPLGRRNSVLLRSSGDALSHGAIFWEGNGDGFDLTHFTASGELTPTSSRPRPDLKSEWVDFWGADHIKNPSGPLGRRSDPGLSLPGRDRLRSGSLTLEAIRLDPKAHPDLGAWAPSPDPTTPRRSVRPF